MLAVAERFHKLPHEVEDISPEEFAECIAYLNVTAQEQKEAQEKAKAKQRTGRRSR